MTDSIVVAGVRESTTVALPWCSRDELLHRLAADSGAGAIVPEFVAAGSSRPIRLDDREKWRLFAACTDWLNESPDQLPEGIYALRNALLADQPQPPLESDRASRSGVGQGGVRTPVHALR
jgi:hypothetical protein